MNHAPRHPSSRVAWPMWKVQKKNRTTWTEARPTFQLASVFTQLNQHGGPHEACYINGCKWFRLKYQSWLYGRDSVQTMDVMKVSDHTSINTHHCNRGLRSGWQSSQMLGVWSSPFILITIAVVHWELSEKQNNIIRSVSLRLIRKSQWLTGHMRRLRDSGQPLKFIFWCPPPFSFVTETPCNLLQKCRLIHCSLKSSEVIRFPSKFIQLLTLHQRASVSGAASCSTMYSERERCQE